MFNKYLTGILRTNETLISINFRITTPFTDTLLTHCL